MVVGPEGRGVFTAERPSDLGKGWSILQRHEYVQNY